MKKFVAILAAMMFAILAVLPMTGACAENVDAGYGVTRYVASDNGLGVRMRTGSSTSAKVLFNLGEGRPVTVLSEANGWSQVREMVNGKTYTGYIMSKYLSKTDPSTARQTFKTVTPFEVKVRTATATGKVSMWDTTAKLTKDKIRDLTRTETLTVIEESRAWYVVVDENNMVGFVAKAYVTKC